jgi:hypothetical protein
MTKTEMLDLLNRAAKDDYEARDTVTGWGDALTVADREEGSDGRWTRQVTLVVADESGNLWRYTFEHGLTEGQEDSWYGSADSLVQVEKHEETVTKVVVTYRPVDAPEGN